MATFVKLNNSNTITQMKIHKYNCNFENCSSNYE